MRVVHILPALLTGGAQMMLVKLLETARGGETEQLVVALSPGGGLWGRAAATGAEVRDLGLRPGELSLKALGRLAMTLRRWRPDVVHGWMYHGNLAALLAARLSGRRLPVLWNVRHSLHDPALEKRATRLVIKAGAPLSHLTDAIVYNSSVSMEQHQAHGYARRGEVIPNGFDAERFRPEPLAAGRLRETLGLGPERRLIGLVARYHPMKDHANLITAAGRLLTQGLDPHLVLLGEGVTAANGELAGLIAAQGLEGRASLLGERPDVAQLVPALDALVLCSAWGEGFPNVLGEAMACGIPCVATDVGDCRALLAGIGAVVPPRNSEALAAALARTLRLPASRRAQLAAAGRERIEREFSLAAIADRYGRLYERLAGPTLASRGRARVKASYP